MKPYSHTHTPGWDQKFLTYIIGLYEEKRVGRPLRLVQNFFREQAKETGLRLFLLLEGGARVRVSAYGKGQAWFELPTCVKGRSTENFLQLCQVWG